MARPVVSTFTERLYGRLPDLYREADETQADGLAGYPLLRYLSLLFDQAGDVETLIDRVDFVDEPATSDLVDPATADAAWLPWLAQLAGVDLADVTDTAARREIISRANDNRADGSLAAMSAQVAPLLTGEKNLRIVSHYNGDPWHVSILTTAVESAGTTAADILEAAGRQKPAGVVLSHQFGLTWLTLETGYPTWADIELAGSWGALV